MRGEFSGVAQAIPATVITAFGPIVKANWSMDIRAPISDVVWAERTSIVVPNLAGISRKGGRSR